jgi:adhesin transport system membrane fusion protein
MQLLVNRRSKSKVDLIRIKKELSQLRGDLQSTYINIPKAKYAMEEAKNRISEKAKIFRAEASNELQKLNTEIKKYESKLVSEEDKLDKTILHSPVDGIVKQINVNTVGGVIKSGMDLIEIVPQSDILLIEAKIDPKDIAFINPQQKAIIKVTAYDFSIYGGLDGKIVEISADSILDKNDKNQKSYYKVMIKTNQTYLEKNGDKLPIIPGMITSVDIVTGKKSILDFILKPILKTKQNAMHER